MYFRSFWLLWETIGNVPWHPVKISSGFPLQGYSVRIRITTLFIETVRQFSSDGASIGLFWKGQYKFLLVKDKNSTWLRENSFVAPTRILGPDHHIYHGQQPTFVEIMFCWLSTQKSPVSPLLNSAHKA